jgi:hypothetical protein
MKLLIQVSSMNDTGQHEHQSWIVDAEARLADVLAAAHKNTSIGGNQVMSRIIDTGDATKADVHATKHLAVNVNPFTELVAALQWYADEVNYQSNGVAMAPHVNGPPDSIRPRPDRGLIARTALGKLSRERKA